MPFRRPLKLGLNGALQEMGDDDIQVLRNRAIVNHGRDQGFRLTVVGSNTGSLNSMTDTRKKGGAVSEVDSAGAGNVTIEPTTYDRISSNTDNTGYNNDANKISYPVYYESDGNSAHLKIRAMTDSDFKDTFIRPVINTLVNGGTGVGNQGVYFVTQDSTSSNLVSSTPIFIDTVFDVNTYAGGHSGNLLLPEDSDQPKINAKYYLARSPIDSSISIGANIIKPLLIDSTTISSFSPTIREMDSGSIDDLLLTSMKDTEMNDPHGYKVRYQIAGPGHGAVSGTQVGTSIIDKAFAGQTIFSNNITGYFQALPYGDSFGGNVPAVVSTYQLKIRKE